MYIVHNNTEIKPIFLVQISHFWLFSKNFKKNQKFLKTPMHRMKKKIEIQLSFNAACQFSLHGQT